MIIACDVDGVLCDFVGGLGLREEDITDYDIRSCIGGDRWAECVRMISTPGWCRSLSPYEGARDAVDAMRANGRVVFATAPADTLTWAREREEWLIEEMGAAASDIVSVRDKTLVRADVLIEDSCATIHKWIARTMRSAVRVERAWNRGGEGVIANVRTLPEAVRICR